MKQAITLKLGNKCNFSCRHCCQGEFAGQVEENLPINPAIFAYIEQESREWQKEKRPLKGRPDGTQLTKLRFWGGEPLLYWDLIKALTKKVQGMPVDISIVSNGALLTQEMVDFLNEHQLDFIVSCDGASTDKVRSANIFGNDNFLRLFKKVKRRSVNTILHAYSQDLPQVWRYIKEKAGGATEVWTEQLMAVDGMPEDICAFDLPAFEKTMQKLVKDLDLNRVDATYHFLTAQLQNILFGLLNPDKARGLHCGQAQWAMCLDLQGNIYPCHNFGEKIADITMPTEDIARVYQETIRQNYSQNIAKCADCEVFGLCRGHCPFVKESANKEMCCHVRRIFFKGLVDYINKSEAKQYV